MANRIQFRRDTAARWKSINPILQEGELGIEKDTGLKKIGNGIDNWNNLTYHCLSGTTSLRPILSSNDSGIMYFDTTIRKPIWWTGSNWIDALGQEI